MVEPDLSAYLAIVATMHKARMRNMRAIMIPKTQINCTVRPVQTTRTTYSQADEHCGSLILTHLAHHYPYSTDHRFKSAYPNHICSYAKLLTSANHIPLPNAFTDLRLRTNSNQFAHSMLRQIHEAYPSVFISWVGIYNSKLGISLHQNR